MRSRIVRIGNSRGIRIPKPLIEQTGLGDEVEISVEDNRLVIGPASQPREGWAEAFKEMAKAGDDRWVDDHEPAPTSWDQEEWEW
ncbi:MAG: AbrB/MazE/SpoVT family DNA-binding domain-containing protein [Candidatus Eisenbacteria sp.]|nr:AbrB/MazE/SpoVT family DNA-binding domain-containing protein [Candidatus Eisenbacteria bacterium]